MQRDLVEELQRALRAREEAVGALRKQALRLGASRAMAAYRSSMKYRLSYAVATWHRVTVSMKADGVVRLNERQLRSSQALAESRAVALVDSRAAAQAASEEARRLAEELDVVRRAQAATQFRREGDRSRREGIEHSLLTAQKTERRLRQAARSAALARVLMTAAMNPLGRCLTAWRIYVLANRLSPSARDVPSARVPQGSQSDPGAGSLFGLFGLLGAPGS